MILERFMNLSDKVANEFAHFLRIINYKNKGEPDSSLSEADKKNLSL